VPETVAMVVAVEATPVAVAVPAPAMVAAADAAHARTRATHKAARAVSPHKLATRTPNLHVNSKHGLNMTTMPNPPAMSLQASHLPDNRPAATVAAFVAAAPQAVVAVADHARVAVVAAVAVQAAAATPALSTAVKPSQRPHILVRPFNIGLLTRFGFAGLFRTSARLSP
jgi:hypothetical protein